MRKVKWERNGRKDEAIQEVRDCLEGTRGGLVVNRMALVGEKEEIL